MLQKQSLDISFAKGLDEKSDPWRVTPGNFLSLVNSVFLKGGLLQKRNGFGSLTPLPVTNASYLTTFNGDLTALGTDFYAYSSNTDKWVNRGSFIPLTLSTLPLIRSNTMQSAVDVAINQGLVCTTYADYNGSTTVYKFAVADATTGQVLIAPTPIAPGVGAVVVGAPRVFAIGNFFAVVFGANLSGSDQLRYQAISVYNLTIGPATIIELTYVATATGSFDGVVTMNRLYLACNTGTGVEATYINQYLAQANTVIVDGANAGSIISLTSDTVSGNVWILYWNASNSNLYFALLNQALATVTTGLLLASTAITSVTAAIVSANATVFYEIPNTYTYLSDDGGGTPAMAPTHYVSSVTVSSLGVVGTPTVVARSVGLASKAFVVSGLIYFLAAFQSLYQPSYFLLNSQGQVASRLAYSNGGGYVTTGLCSAIVQGTSVYVGYQIADLVQAVNKAQNVPAAAAGGVYSQTGLNLVHYDFTSSATVTSEIAGSLHLSGGLLWQYDGYTPVEHGFNVWPDALGATQTTGGSMTVQPYNYQATYEWSDNQGNVHRSAPSVPLVVNLTSGNSAVQVFVPTLRLTYKIASPVKIVLYRWSAGQEVFYQVTSILQPTLNNTAVDNITFLDTQADGAIIGNNILYTVGGVVENIGAPGLVASALYKTRLFMIDAEDPNLLWYSKQVIEDTPVEMSDLFTIYVPPVASAGLSTGPNKAISVMDDKLILFKQNAIGYLTGEGPNNTGALNDYSDVVYITSTIGCVNQRSIVFTPQGLMFQSANNQGIWLLGRDLSTQYIGAPVEGSNSLTVMSAITVPGTTQVRFTMSDGSTLMYDYYFGQWGSFEGSPALSSVVFQNLHTQVNTYGQITQETPGAYLDGSNPVLMGFKTGWIALSGLQGYERFYFMYLLGRWITPFKLNVSLAYDYNEASNTQTTQITPNNSVLFWGSDSVWGGSSPWGGNGNVFEARLFPQKQKCESFQVTLQEIYDPSYGVQAGAGLTLSGMNLIIGAKKPYRSSQAAHNFG